MTEQQRCDVMAIILHSATNGARNVRAIILDSVGQVRMQDEKITHLPSPRQMSDFIAYAKRLATESEVVL